MADIERNSVSVLEDDSGSLRSLQLEENYFSQSEDIWNMEKIPEIQAAIEQCKENILALVETSEEKRLLVQKLVKLRLRLQEVQELEIYMDPKKMKVIQSHKFICQSVSQFKFHSYKIYCETCSGLIWIPVQSCFECIDCSYKSHGQCLNTVKRTCASVKVKEKPCFILEICPEKSLESQHYRCAECKIGIRFSSALALPMLCDYSGHYYCAECHWGTTSIIPARVLLNWDFQEYPVSRDSQQFLNLMMKKPILNLESVNPRLFSFVEELALVKRLRCNIMIMKEYILTCKDAIDAKLLRLLEERQHFVENSDFYSLQDLVDVFKKDLITYLEPIHNQFLVHITQDCVGCRGKGHVCRLCGQLPEIFPFEILATLCEKCHSVYHRTCVNKREAVCPKCNFAPLYKKDRFPLSTSLT